MQRILVVLRGSVGVETLRDRYRRATSGRSAPHELAICMVLGPELHGLTATVDAQRRLTVLLRHAIGDAAEGVAVFVASDLDGYGVEDCARDWEATIIDS